MAGSKIAESFEKIVNNSAQKVGQLQVGVNKLLWGRANTQPTVTVQLTPATGSNQTSRLTYNSTVPTSTIPQTAQQKGLKNFAQSGLFNILNALNSVDLCAVITYAYDNINVRKKKRPPRDEQTQAQRAFYDFQDICGDVVRYIDKFNANPTVFITSYAGFGTNDIPPVIAAADTNAPVQGGTQVAKYNAYFLMQAIREAFTTTSGPNSLFSQEDLQTIRAVPGLINNLNFLRDTVSIIDAYTEYLQIPDVVLQRIVDNLGKIRAVCVTVQNLDIQNLDSRQLANLAANFLGSDIRSQIQQLNKFVDVTKIIPTLKQVNDALRSFIRIANQVQSIITTGQFIIKIGTLLYKVFRFILTFFSGLPVPLVFSTAGIQTLVQDAKNKAKDESDGVVRVLQAINALLAVVVTFVRYVVGNANELLIRLEQLLATLRGCEAMKDSDILAELENTYAELVAVRDRLETYLINYESKTDPNTAQLGEYQIRVLDEQVVETTIVNKRRRGVALDINGAIVVQSDLTFATNTQIIIEEVKQKLIAAGLIRPLTSAISPLDLQVFSESFNYLDNNDILTEDLNIPEGEVELPDNLNENQGLGLQAFVNNLKGGRRLRRRMREKLAADKRALAGRLQSNDSSNTLTQNLANQQIAEANKLEIQNLRERIAEWRKEVSVAAVTAASPASALLIKDRRARIAAAQKRIQELGG